MEIQLAKKFSFSPKLKTRNQKDFESPVKRSSRVCTSGKDLAVVSSEADLKK